MTEIETNLDRRQFLKYVALGAVAAASVGLDAACSNLPGPFAQPTQTTVPQPTATSTEVPIDPTKIPTKQAPTVIPARTPVPTLNVEESVAKNVKGILTAISIGFSGKAQSFDEIISARGYKYDIKPTPGQVGLVTRLEGTDSFSYPFPDMDLQKLATRFDPLPSGIRIPIPVTIDIKKEDHNETWLYHLRQPYKNTPTLGFDVFELMEEETPEGKFVAIEVQ